MLDRSMNSSEAMSPRAKRSARMRLASSSGTRSAEIAQRQSSRAPQIEPCEHESQDQEQEEKAAEEGQHGEGVVLPSVRAVGYAWIHESTFQLV